MPFVSLKRVLESVLKEHALTSDIDAYRIFSLWGQIAGPTVANHCRPVRIKDDILYVEVDDPIWLSQMRYMKEEILRKIETQIKPGIVKELKLFLK